MTARNSAGCSRWVQWLAPGKTWLRASGICSTNGSPGGRGGFVELAGDHQRRRDDAVQPVDDRPGLERAEDVKLVGAVHGVVDGRLGLHLRLAVEEVLRRRSTPADVAPVELLRRREVLRVGDGARGLVPVERLLRVRGQLGAQARGGRHPELHRGRGVADRQGDQPVGAADGDLGAEHPAPGLPEQVVRVDAQFGSHGVELVDEQRRLPEVPRRVGQVGAAAAADLVVVDHRASGLVGQRGDVAHVVVRHAGPAVEHEQRMGVGPRVSGVVICTHVSKSRNGTVRV